MKPTSRANHAALMVLSLIISLIIWVEVNLTVAPKAERTYVVDVLPRNRPVSLAVVSYAHKVSIPVSGQTAVFSNFDSSGLKAYVDLDQAKPGANSYPVIVEGLPRWTSVQKDLKVKVECERIVTKSMQVTVVESGNLRDTAMTYQGCQAQPSSVNVVGPSSRVDTITSVRAYLDLTHATPDSFYTVGVYPMHGSDRVGEPVRCEPASVTLFPRVAPAPYSRALLVTPVFSGQPAPGYEVTSVEVTPEQVFATGPRKEVGRASVIRTGLIKIAGRTASVSYQVALVPPRGLRVIGAHSVRVTVKIEPVPSLSAPKSTNAP